MIIGHDIYIYIQACVDPGHWEEHIFDTEDGNNHNNHTVEGKTDSSLGMSPLYLQVLQTSRGAIGNVLVHLHLEKICQSPLVPGIYFDTKGLSILSLKLHLASKKGKCLFEGEVYWRKYK